MQLHPACAAAGVRLIAHDVVGSTNSEAFALARSGERGPLWITAERQTAGRGRRGRAWTSETGNLHASLLLTDPSPAARAAELSFVAALAVHDALGEVAPALGPALKLKWPNDVLVGGAKVAGILIEGEGTRPLAIAVGIGVNCVRHPGATSYPATDLAACGAVVTPVALLCALSAAMLSRLRQWDRGAGFAAIREHWIDRAANVGEEIRIELPERTLAGHFQALDARGHLLLRLPDGSSESVAAGEVFPLSGASPDPGRATDGGTH
jgi:BirA family biotin operon repressor/biotin-[acetyl-CoA-carboxylase] ligase